MSEVLATYFIQQDNESQFDSFEGQNTSKHWMELIFCHLFHYAKINSIVKASEISESTIVAVSQIYERT